MVLEHVTDRQVAPVVYAGLVGVVVGAAEQRAQPVGALAGLGDGVGVVDAPVGVGDVLREALDPPDGRGADTGLEVAVHVVPAVEVVGVLVVEVPDREVRYPLGVVGDEPGLVADGGRVALQVHPAVVGADVEDDAGVALVVRAGVEDRHLDGRVVVVRHRPVVADDVVEVGVLVLQAGAGGGELGGGHRLGDDPDAGAADVVDGQHRRLQPGGEVAGAVVGAVRPVVRVGLAGQVDPERGGAAGHRGAAQQVPDQRADGGDEFGVLKEAAELQAGVRGEVVPAGAEQRVVGDGEVAQCREHTRVGLDGGEEAVRLVAAPEHGVDVVHRRDHRVGAVPGAVVAREFALDDAQVAGVLGGAVDQDDGLGEGGAVRLGDVAGVRVAEEVVEAAADGALQGAAVGADGGGVVPLDVVAGPQEEHQLPDGGAVVAGVAGRGVAQRVGDADHLRLAEHRVGVVAGEQEERVHAVQAGGLDLLDERAAAPAAEVGGGAGGRGGGLELRARVLGGRLLGGRLLGGDVRLERGPVGGGLLLGDRPAVLGGRGGLRGGGGRLRGEARAGRGGGRLGRGRGGHSARLGGGGEQAEAEAARQERYQHPGDVVPRGGGTHTGASRPF